jgi:GntR family transcriptional regulator
LNALLSFSAAARSRGVEPGTRILVAEVVPSPPAVVFQLHLAAGEPVVFLRRIRLLDGVAAVVQESWLPHAVCPGLLDDHDVADLSLYTVLTERYGLDLARGHTVISARLASVEEREWLELPDPAAVIMVDQLTSTREGRPVELSNSVYHPHRYPLSIVHGDSSPPRGMAVGHQASRWSAATVT